MQLMLNDEEQQVLLEILLEVLPNLREEVYKTENFDVRVHLKRRKETINTLLGKLGAPTQ